MAEDIDRLRDKLNETGELAKLLFEQQFIRHGGRKPADPEWSDLDETERDEWWDRALDAKPLIEAARRSSMFAAVSGYQLAEKDMDLLLWLHAEARWLAYDLRRRLTESQLDLLERGREVARLRREVEFEANAMDTAYIPGSVCACVPDDEAGALVQAGFTRPQCTVHPDGGAE